MAVGTYAWFESVQAHCSLWDPYTSANIFLICVDDSRKQSARLPYQGVPVSTEGQEHVPSSMTRDPGPSGRLKTGHVLDPQWRRVRPGKEVGRSA
jgi:hypothetical protein